MAMLSLYFSGTGNTKHCVERFVKAIDGDAEIIEIEKAQSANLIQNEDTIVFAYPVYYSNLPKIVRDYITRNKAHWRGKKIFIIATMGAFSGDGAGCAARLFKKYGSTVLGGLHLKMPDCIGDNKLLKKSLDQNRKFVENADAKIDKAIERFKAGKNPKDGLSFFHHLAGLFGQRLYFRGKTKHYYAKIKSDHEKCVRCGLCASLCPMQNIALKDGKIVFNGNCTMCYRCFSNCPEKAITVIGKKVYEQCKFDNYI